MKVDEITEIKDSGWFPRKLKLLRKHHHRPGCCWAFNLRIRLFKKDEFKLNYRLQSVRFITRWDGDVYLNPAALKRSRAAVRVHQQNWLLSQLNHSLVCRCGSALVPQRSRPRKLRLTRLVWPQVRHQTRNVCAQKPELDLCVGKQ